MKEVNGVKQNETAKKTPNGQKKDETKAEGVIFVPYTAGSKLRSRLQNEDDKLTRIMRMPRLRYVERPGRTVADSLVTKDPWYLLQGGCSKQNCPVCYWMKGKRIRCTRENVSYRLDCMVCEKRVEEVVAGAKKSFYLGETSRSGRERVKEHLWLFSHRKQACLDTSTKPHKHSSTNSALWCHSKKDHGGTLSVSDWKVTLTSSHRGALNRQGTEAVSISNHSRFPVSLATNIKLTKSPNSTFVLDINHLNVRIYTLIWKIYTFPTQNKIFRQKKKYF